MGPGSATLSNISRHGKKIDRILNAVKKTEDRRTQISLAGCLGMNKKTQKGSRGDKYIRETKEDGGCQEDEGELYWQLMRARLQAFAREDETRGL